MKDADVRFHEQWLGLAQPVEGLVFSVPALVDAQIAPKVSAGITAELDAQLEDTEHGLALRDVQNFFETFLGYARPGMLVGRDDLPTELKFYAQEGRQEIRPSFAIARGPFESPDDDPFAKFEATPVESTPAASTSTPNEASAYMALVWDITTDAGPAGVGLDLDKAEAETGPWRYPPTAKLERLLRHTGIPIGFISNRRALRVVYAPSGESSAHLTFRFEDLAQGAGRPLVAALELIFHAQRTYGAAPEFTFEGLLRESRLRQADVTKELAAQVFEAVEILLEGYEHAAARDCVGDRVDWLREALEAPDDHLYQGVVSVALRLVFALYAEDQQLLPSRHPTYAKHLSVFELYDRLSDDASSHGDSMRLRFGAYGRLIALFRAVFLGVTHRDLRLPARRGKLFDPGAYPFLEGGLPAWTASIADPKERAEVQVPSVDDATIYEVLRRLIVHNGQRLSYRALDVEQLGAVYESLMGYHVVRVTSPAVRLGPDRVWIETEHLLAMSARERRRQWKQAFGLSKQGQAKAEAAVTRESGTMALAEELAQLSPRGKGQRSRHVAASGRLVLQPGQDRRRTGSHYTPRRLSEKVVKRTLQPVLAGLGEHRTAQQILNLRICDPAVGSGAFLVAACRLLADEVVAAWDRAGETAALTEKHGDAVLLARRLVAQRCLYGVDKNSAAVELAKLSLWLVTLSKELPFTFVDHALRHGDSLVGLDATQIAEFTWDQSRRVLGARDLVVDALTEALEYRQSILALSGSEDPETQATKHRLLDHCEGATALARMIADACVGAFFSQGTASARERERRERLDVVRQMLAGDETSLPTVAAMASGAREATVPFHWDLEFPEVFAPALPTSDTRTGFDAVVGNMPFLGGRRIATQYGDRYSQWLLTRFGCSGDTDYVGYFFLQSPRLVSTRAATGLIATSSLAEGQNRQTVIKPLLQRHGFRIDHADTRLPWPGEANVLVSILHFVRGLAQMDPPVLDGRSVQAINSRLRPKPERSEPTKLDANRGYALVGCFLRGTGFILDEAEAKGLIDADPRNAEVVRPFVVGDDLNNALPNQIQRWVVDFAGLSLEEAQTYTSPFQVVQERVLPERLKLKKTGADAAHRQFWWRFANTRQDLRRRAKLVGRFLATARLAKHSAFTFISADVVPSEQVVVVPVDSYSTFAVLESRIHAAWVDLTATRMGAGLRYSASHCFETFAFPLPDPGVELAPLESTGRALYEARHAFLHLKGYGLTKAHNALRDPRDADPAILKLRALYEAADRAVLDAYGWVDVPVPPYCSEAAADQKATDDFVDEILDRLHLLNAARATDQPDDTTIKKELAVATAPLAKTRESDTRDDRRQKDAG